ncbi:nitrate regulatory gene2 protein-like [Senna tora]|uniref:Nitrate regulatory gene2 protein-like n=1 Tax=Senna tora TaxID=362788 RepID=A0A834WN93_9FABA|nr:nitrate regulatory gene2 protein-like [Senna tora]
MGCATSKKLSKEDDVVSFCRERKSLIKLALERRYALAEAHCKYNHSLYAVALAIRLFVARHSSSSSPFLLTFPSATTDSEPTPFLQHKPSSDSEPTCEGNPGVKQSKDNDDDDDELSDEEEPLCEHFYGDVGAPLSSPRRNYQWDFFNLFDVSSQVVSGLTQNTSEQGERVECGSRFVGENKATRTRDEDDTKLEPCGSKKLSDINGGIDGRELLEALKEVEDHFIKAYDSGKVVSRMLEAHRIPLHSGLDDIKGYKYVIFALGTESSKKLIRSITWNRSNSMRSSSGKSLLTSSSRSSSTWTDLSIDSYEDCGGMGSGSHSLTIERLYAWEKKLYEEVKAGEEIRKVFERKCSRFKNKKAIEDSLQLRDKSSVEAVELYTRILVSVRTAESISKRIQKLKDEELLPQLVELLNGLMKNWKMMLESHETQYQILNQVRFFNCPSYGKFCNGSHRLATIELEAELQNWRACFTAIVSAEKAYIEALHGWLSEFRVSEVEMYSWGMYSTLPYKINKPPLLVITHDWLAWLEKMPDKKVNFSIKSFSKDIQTLWVQQGKELRQKRKVDELSKEIDRRNIAFQREESKILGSECSEQEAEASVQTRIQYLSKKKDLLETYRKRLEAERAKHQSSLVETQNITLNAFESGLCSVFQALAEFSKASIKVYASLVNYSENAKLLLEGNGTLSGYSERRNYPFQYEISETQLHLCSQSSVNDHSSLLISEVLHNIPPNQQDSGALLLKLALLLLRKKQTNANSSPFKPLLCFTSGITFLLKKQYSNATTITVKMPATKPTNIVTPELLELLGSVNPGGSAAASRRWYRSTIAT